MIRRLSYAEWTSEARRRFGDDSLLWRFECPSCGLVQSLGDFKKAGIADAERVVAFSCIGRWRHGGAEAFRSEAHYAAHGENGCNYAGGGFIRINPVEVTAPDGSVHRVFEFAEESRAR